MLNFLKKDFLVGLGAGFIISGIMIAYFGIGELSDEEIRARAAKLGMSQQPDSVKEQKMPSLPEDTSNSVDKSTTDQTPITDKTSKTTETPITTEAPITTEKYVNQTPVKKPTYVIVEIKSGMGSETVAKILEEKGVVKDRNEFYKLVTEKRAHSRFKVGKFSVPAGGDMESILNILTGKR